MEINAGLENIVLANQQEHDRTNVPKWAKELIHSFFNDVFEDSFRYTLASSKFHAPDSFFNSQNVHEDRIPKSQCVSVIYNELQLMYTLST